MGVLFKPRFAQRRIQPFEQLLVQRLGVAVVFPVLHDGLQLGLLRAGHVQMAALRGPDGVFGVHFKRAYTNLSLSLKTEKMSVFLD